MLRSPHSTKTGLSLNQVNLGARLLLVAWRQTCPSIDSKSVIVAGIIDYIPCDSSLFRHSRHEEDGI